MGGLGLAVVVLSRTVGLKVADFSFEGAVHDGLPVLGLGLRLGLGLGLGGGLMSHSTTECEIGTGFISRIRVGRL